MGACTLGDYCPLETHSIQEEEEVTIMRTVIKSVPTNNNSFDFYYCDGTVRHNVGSDGLSDEDRAQMEAESAAYYSTHCGACNDILAECSCPLSLT